MHPISYIIAYIIQECLKRKYSELLLIAFYILSVVSVFGERKKVVLQAMHKTDGYFIYFGCLF